MKWKRTNYFIKYWQRIQTWFQRRIPKVRVALFVFTMDISQRLEALSLFSSMLIPSFSPGNHCGIQNRHTERKYIALQLLNNPLTVPTKTHFSKRTRTMKHYSLCFVFFYLSSVNKFTPRIRYCPQKLVYNSVFYFMIYLLFIFYFLDVISLLEIKQFPY